LSGMHTAFSIDLQFQSRDIDHAGRAPTHQMSLIPGRSQRYHCLWYGIVPCTFMTIELIDEKHFRCLPLKGRKWVRHLDQGRLEVRNGHQGLNKEHLAWEPSPRDYPTPQLVYFLIQIPINLDSPRKSSPARLLLGLFTSRTSRIAS
jgi:hypothetical protein